jgi:hypothetical protein
MKVLHPAYLRLSEEQLPFEMGYILFKTEASALCHHLSLWLAQFKSYLKGTGEDR